MEAWIHRIPSPLGDLYAVRAEGAIVGLSFDPEAAERRWAAGPGAATPDPRAPLALQRQLGEYFEGRRRCFDLPLELRGAPSNAGSGRRSDASPGDTPPPTATWPGGWAHRAPHGPSGPPWAPIQSCCWSPATGCLAPRGASSAMRGAWTGRPACSGWRAENPPTGADRFSAASPSRGAPAGLRRRRRDRPGRRRGAARAGSAGRWWRSPAPA